MKLPDNCLKVSSVHCRRQNIAQKAFRLSTLCLKLLPIMTKKLLKQVVGIDIALKKIDVSLGWMDQEANTEVHAFTLD